MEGRDLTPVVVGMGVVSPAGNSIDELASHVFGGKVGNIVPITRFDASAFEVRIAGEVDRSDKAEGERLDWLVRSLEGVSAPPELVGSIRKAWRRMDNFTRDAIMAGAQAVESAGQAARAAYSAMSEEAVVKALEDTLRPQVERLNAVLAGCNSVPVIIGSGYGGLEQVLEGEAALKSAGPRMVSARLIQESMINSAAARLASVYQLLGQNYGVSNACASGTQAIIGAAERITLGAEGALAIGGDALELAVTIAAFTNAGALSRYEGDPKLASRPWDADRRGFVLSEGAAAIYMMPKYLAKKAGVAILAELAGWDGSNDARWNVNNMAEPSIRGPVLSMSRALAMGGLLGSQDGSHGELSSLAYINAHATATTVGDVNEAKAIALVLGEEYVKSVAVGSTKSIHGHLIGGAGAIESIICILALQRGLVPGNVNLNRVDEKIAATGIYLPTKTVAMRETGCPRYALSNSFGFGGANASVLWRDTRQ